MRWGPPLWVFEVSVKWISMEVWENEKCCEKTSLSRVFPQLFRVLQNFHECFYNSIETRRTCCLFLLENTATKRKKNNLLTLIIKMEILVARAITTITTKKYIVTWNNIVTWNKDVVSQLCRHNTKRETEAGSMFLAITSFRRYQSVFLKLIWR